MSVFLLVSVFLYLMISGRKAALLLVLSAYLGYAVAIAFPDILDKYPYSQYFRPAVFIGALLVSVKILHKFIVLKRGELTFVPAILFFFAGKRDVFKHIFQLNYFERSQLESDYRDRSH